MNEESRARTILAAFSDVIARLPVAGSIAVIDGGSSDRTIEVVDEFALCSPVGIRVVGSSRPGWTPAVLRGVATSPARRIGVGDPHVLGPRANVLLTHALRVLAGGAHVVTIGGNGRHVSLMDRDVAALIVGDAMPDGAGSLPVARDTADYAGLRMSAYSVVSNRYDLREDTTDVLPVPA
ncbi:glycosyltransferase [Actinoplanes sp. NPDC048796]|uniref:glycosyltransferase n=1 Tax=unclassified Actinoplanes TaxID=2626549 RepID=UPI0033E41239